MLKITLITTLILGVSGKISRSLDFDESFNNVDSNELHLKNRPEAKDTVWILNLDSDLIDPLKIRVASKDEAEEFAAAAGPLIDRFDRRPNRPARRPQPKSVISDSALKALKTDILRTVNKFILSAGAEPGIEVTEDVNQGPTLSLMFRGPYSSLILTHGDNQWHYFINPPSPLPSWFYDRPSGVKSAKIAEIPENVGREFFRGLLRLIRVFLSKPL